MNDLGERVRVARERRGMTQSDLARATGLSPGAVSRIEAGQCAPGSGTVARLAQALGVEAGHLLTGDSPATPTMLPTMAPQPHDGEVLEAIQLIARDMPSLPQAGRQRVLSVLRAVLG